MANKVCYYVLVALLNYFVGCVLTVNVATGTGYTFKPTTSGTIKGIEWRYNNGSNLLVEWDYPSDPIWYQYENRATLDLKTGELTINMLKKSDSGRFDFNYYTEGPLTSYTFTLQVFDNVTKPTITCQQNDKSATLLCSLDPPVPANFTWSGPNGLLSSGKSLQVTRKENDAGLTYFCTVTNEVSKDTTETNLQLCQSKDHEINVAAIVGSIVAVILVLVGVGVGVVLYKKYCKGAANPGERRNANSTNHHEDPATAVPLTTKE